MELKELNKFYEEIKWNIEKRLLNFKTIFENGTEEDIFAEFAFCLLTPQSKAKICWAAVERLTKSRVLFIGEAEDILKELIGVRFKNKKSKYIVEARNKFSEKKVIKIKQFLLNSDEMVMREWLVKNIKGMGYKEAGHFLRNIGFGETITILDRHILKNLKLFGVINEIPSSISKGKYFEIEEKMKNFSEKTKIPLSHMDLLLWCKQTGEIFK